MCTQLQHRSSCTKFSTKFSTGARDKLIPMGTTFGQQPFFILKMRIFSNIDPRGSISTAITNMITNGTTEADSRSDSQSDR